MKRLFLYITLLVLFFVPATASANAFVVGESQQVKFNFGSFKMPKDAYVEQYDFKKALDKADAKVKKELSAFTDLINIYQVMLFDGNSYYNASVVTVFLDNNLLDKYPFSMSGKKSEYKFELLPEYKSFIVDNQEKIKEYMQIMTINSKNQMDYSKLYKISFASSKDIANTPSFLLNYEWPQIEQFTVGDNFGYKTDVRLNGILFGLYGNFYMQAYAYNNPDKGAIVMFLFTVDSQREFWQPIFKNVLN